MKWKMIYLYIFREGSSLSLVPLPSPCTATRLQLHRQTRCEHVPRQLHRQHRRDWRSNDPRRRLRHTYLHVTEGSGEGLPEAPEGYQPRQGFPDRHHRQEGGRCKHPKIFWSHTHMTRIDNFPAKLPGLLLGWNLPTWPTTNLPERWVFRRGLGKSSPATCKT